MACLIFFCATQVQAGHFPEPKVIEPNILFWEKIYGHYSENDGIVHDSHNLGLVYESIPLLDRELPAATRINRELRSYKIEKYQKILIRLSKTLRPKNSEEKRILSHFKGKDIREQLEDAAGNIRIQTGLKNRFAEGVVRSGKYLPEMKRIFASYNLPTDLAYLPHVESSFNNSARSKAGASGMWQFTRPTGKDYLTVNDLVDERSDPLYAADAAARYLRDSYNALGEWPLALTSYNYGRAGMLRAQKAKGSYSKIFTSYSEGYFKFASRNFYPEFIAAVRVAKRLENDPRIQKDKPERSVYFTTKGYVSTATIGRFFKLPERVIAERNPALSQFILTGEKYIPAHYKVRLPSTRLTREKVNKFPRHSYQKRQKKDSFYIVRQGDTAGGIARKFGTSTATLKQINNLDDAANVYIRQKLLLPIKN